MIPALRRFGYLVAIAIATALACGFWQQDHAAPDPVSVAVLAAMAFAAQSRPVELSERAGLSLASVLLLTGGALTGPVGGALIGLVAIMFAPRRQPHIVRAFNALMAAALGTAAGWVYAAAGGWSAAGSWARDHVLQHVVLPLAAAAVTIFALNALLVAGMVHTSGQANGPVRSTLRVLLETASQGYAVSTSAAFLFITLWVGARLDELSALLMTTPLLLAQWILQEREAGRAAQRRTVRVFAQLSAVFDPERAHQGREAADLARQLGAHLNLSPRELDRVRFGASLGWIGEIDAARALHEPRAREERAQALLRGIPSIEGVRELVAQRERPWNGSAGSLPAGVVCVATAIADGVDVDAGSGTLFDPRVVRAVHQTQGSASRAARIASGAIRDADSTKQVG